MIRRGDPSVFVISLTPFDRSGKVDYGAARQHFARLAEAGVGVYVGGGGSGEGHTLSRTEVQKLLTAAVEELAGRVPVRAMGVEPRTARQMIDFVKLAKDCGIEAAQIYSLDMGHLGRPRGDEMERYFSDVLDRADLPTVLSTHFSVGYLVPIELLDRLSRRYEGVIGVNCSTPDFTYLVNLLADLNPRVEVHVGGPMQALSNLAMGGTGFLSSEGNLAPKLARSVVAHYAAGDWPAAAEAFTKVNRLFGIGMGAGDMKAIYRSLGLPAGYPRLPRLSHTDDAGVARVRKQLQELGIEELEGCLADTA